MFVDRDIQAALAGAPDRALKLQSMRRRALRQRDAATAAKCLLQLIIEAPAGKHLPRLRQYAVETGSPIAVYTLASHLPGNAATDAALLRLLRTTRSSPDSEREVLASIFGPIDTNKVRDLLFRVLRRAEGRNPPPRLVTVALLELVELELSLGDVRHARDLAVRLTRETPTAITFQLLGLATEQSRDLDGAIAAYQEGAVLADREGDTARAESLRRKVSALRKLKATRGG